VELTLGPDWERARLGVAAFLQDSETRVVVGAAVAAPEAVAQATAAGPGR
jgi:hypothetical protein